MGPAAIVDNHPGAGSTAAPALVAHAPPDGYTLLINTSAQAYSAARAGELPYDPLRDFVPSLRSPASRTCSSPARSPASRPSASSPTRPAAGRRDPLRLPARAGTGTHPRGGEATATSASPPCTPRPRGHGRNSPT